jgi:hypothetical protein
MDNTVLFITLTPSHIMLKPVEPLSYTVTSCYNPHIMFTAGVSNYSIPENPCPSNCTARLTSNLTLAYNFFHMHQVGQVLVLLLLSPLDPAWLLVHWAHPAVTCVAGGHGLHLDSQYDTIYR